MASSPGSTPLAALLLLLLLALLSASAASRFAPTDNHLIACGATAPAVLPDGRRFVPDTGCASTRLRSAAPALTFSTSSARQQNAQVPQKEPKEAAKSVLDSLPGDSIASKIGILSAGTGLSVAAISNELYVVNEESIVFFSLMTIYFGVYNYVGPMYKEFAENYSNKIKNILNAARDDHTNAVKSRISSVSDLGGVIQTTKDLFAVSKETAQLEAQAYEMEQKTALSAESKAVLDSWVRYEGQVKVRQQQELAQSIIAKIEKELENPKVLDQILKQSVADVERIVSQKA